MLLDVDATSDDTSAVRQLHGLCLLPLAGGLLGELRPSSEVAAPRYYLVAEVGRSPCLSALVGDSPVSLSEVAASCFWMWETVMQQCWWKLWPSDCCSIPTTTSYSVCPILPIASILVCLCKWIACACGAIPTVASLPDVHSPGANKLPHDMAWMSAITQPGTQNTSPLLSHSLDTACITECTNASLRLCSNVLRGSRSIPSCLPSPLCLTFSFVARKQSLQCTDATRPLTWESN